MNAFVSDAETIVSAGIFGFALDDLDAIRNGEATMVVSSCARAAVEVSVPPEASGSVEAEDTVSTISPTAAAQNCLRSR